MFYSQVRPLGRRRHGNQRLPVAILAMTRRYWRKGFGGERSRDRGECPIFGHRLEGRVLGVGIADEDVTTNHDVITAARSHEAGLGAPNQHRRQARGQQA